MALKKSELYSSLWKSCDELRGGMDASQYKDYILVLLFVKYVSDRYAGDKNALIEVPKGGGFADMAALKGKKDIGEKINTIILKLAEANDLVGVIDVADFDDSDKLGKGKEMQDRLSRLVAIFENEALNFAKNRADGDDLLGDAYEYLMRNFATESGKSKGQFYTPSEVSRILAKVISIDKAKSQDQTIYDPTCGSGSLLLKAADEAPRGLSIYGQEMDVATTALAKMNMILHGNPTAEIAPPGSSTLSSPHFRNEKGGLKTFDFGVANPPFSSKAWSTGFDPINDEYERFDGTGVPPAKNGDYAFLLHLVKSLKSRGKAAIILPHGVLFRGNAEETIRKNLIRKGYIKGIIGLPANLFYGTGIPACIVVIDKENADSRRGVFMVDASKGFVKDGNKNRLREQDIHKIVDVFNKQAEVPKYARMVPVKEIAEENEYNLNIPRYIDSQEEEDIQNIEAHLRGGIPSGDIDDLAAYWEVYPTLRKELFKRGDRKGFGNLRVKKDDIKATIFENEEFAAYSKTIRRTFNRWAKKQVETLKAMKTGVKPSDVIGELGKVILSAFDKKSLIDKYDVYQHLMAYWAEVMKDDVFMISETGWKAELTPVLNKKKKVTGYTCELIPHDLMVANFFGDVRETLDELEANKEDLSRQMEEMREEHGGDEGLLEEVIGDNGKIAKGALAKRIKVVKKDPEYADELKMLNTYMKLLEQESAATKQIKAETEQLEDSVLQKYSKLTLEEVKTLVVDEKWMTALRGDVDSEMDRISQRLTGRVKELAERYETTMPELEVEVKVLSKKVEGHLRKMGLVWK